VNSRMEASKPLGSKAFTAFAMLSRSFIYLFLRLGDRLEIVKNLREHLAKLLERRVHGQGFFDSKGNARYHGIFPFVLFFYLHHLGIKKSPPKRAIKVAPC